MSEPTSHWIAIAIGDPNGIGPEIAVKAALALRGQAVQPVLVGDRHVLMHYLSTLDSTCDLISFSAAQVASALPASVLVYENVAALSWSDFQPGKVSESAGQATIAYVSRAVALAQSGHVGAVVGCPHSETAINSAGIPFAGYPGLIAHLTNTPAEKVFLMLVAAGLRITHVTLHESVQTALARMTPSLFEAAGAASLKAAKALGVKTPRLGVMGINPHAGEGGLFGVDDERITVPAIERLRALGNQVDGPVGADLLLAQRRHDVYLAPFHDQGHIPVKLLSPLRSSALTIGTPVHFSSVGHGCAHDIAGQGVADPVSVVETFLLLAGALQHY